MTAAAQTNLRCHTAWMMVTAITMTAAVNASSGHGLVAGSTGSGASTNETIRNERRVRHHYEGSRPVGAAGSARPICRTVRAVRSR